jgi:GT2 family glycosyltransferase
MILESSPGKFACVIVTRNRFLLLQRCLNGLLNQTSPPDILIIIDNGSEDETPSLFTKGAFACDDRILYVRIEGNTGGAGGFHTGIARAMELGCDWIWVMDDDGCLESNTLECLMAVHPDPAAIHAAAALADSGDACELVWPVALMEGKDKGRVLTHVDELKGSVIPVQNAPFIGMLFHRSLIEHIGLPDKNFFVSFEDAEMCARAWARAGGVRIVPSAVVRHPSIERLWVKLGPRKISVIALAPWRRYYDTRNRLVLAKRHFGHRLWTEVLPGTLVRWVVTLMAQPGRMAQSAAFMRGIFDALTGRMGIRWSPPGA